MIESSAGTRRAATMAQRAVTLLLFGGTVVGTGTLLVTLGQSMAKFQEHKRVQQIYDQQKAAAAQYQLYMTQDYAMMDRAINHITNEPYIRPSTDLLAPKTREPGEHIVELVYIDLRGVEVGPMSFTVIKSW